jgi:hypothetical protein
VLTLEDLVTIVAPLPASRTNDRETRDPGLKFAQTSSAFPALEMVRHYTPHAVLLGNDWKLYACIQRSILGIGVGISSGSIQLIGACRSR